MKLSIYRLHVHIMHGRIAVGWTTRTGETVYLWGASWPQR